MQSGCPDGRSGPSRAGVARDLVEFPLRDALFRVRGAASADRDRHSEPPTQPRVPIWHAAHSAFTVLRPAFGRAGGQKSEAMPPFSQSP